MTETVTLPVPRGGLARMSRRVMNLAHMLTQNARRHGDRIGFIWGDRSWTWREIDGHVSALAAGLAARGIVKGDRVLVHSKNSDEMFWSMFAAFRLGAVWVPTNFRLMPDEVAYLATASGAKAFLCHGDFPDHATAAANPALEFIWRIGEGAFGEKSVGDVIADHAGARVENAAVDYDDPCWFFFTSGTTGRSKAAVLTHGQMAFVVTNHLADLMPGTTETDASLVVAPLSHGAGVHQLMQVARGVPTILLPTEKFDIAGGVPPDRGAPCQQHVYRADHLEDDGRTSCGRQIRPFLAALRDLCRRADVSRGPEGGAEKTRPGAGAVFRARRGHRQHHGACRPACTIPRTARRPASAPAASSARACRSRSRAMTGASSKPFETGEICVIGPAVFAGYYDNPEANAKAFRDGWFRTGDLGHMDEEGFVYITGRASDMYISGGSNIYPREVEEKILTHPAIGEVAVLGVPDPFWGEVGVAVCVAREGAAAVSEAELAAFLSPKVPRYKMPKRFFFWEALPKSGYGKIPKRLVRDELEARGLLELVAKSTGA